MPKGIRQLNIALTETEHKTLESLKGSESWHDFVMQIACEEAKKRSKEKKK